MDGTTRRRTIPSGDAEGTLRARTQYFPTLTSNTKDGFGYGWRVEQNSALQNLAKLLRSG